MHLISLSDCRSEEEEEDDSEGLVPTSRSSRQKLPPLQSPLGTRFMDNNNSSATTGKQRKGKKSKAQVQEVHDNPNFETSKYSQLSVSRVQVESKNGINGYSDEENDESLSRRSYGSKTNYFGGYEDNSQPNSSRKKQGKKKILSASHEEEEGFDTLRLSQHLEDDDIVSDRLENRPPAQRPGRVLLRKIEGAGMI